MILAVLAITACLGTALAEDWPTYRHDNRRSGVTAESVDAASLKEAWVYRPPHPPQPAWHGPAKWDAYSGKESLRAMRNYDPVFYTIAVGDAVYFGSSAEDTVYALDAATGAVQWARVLDGAIRIAPAYDNGRLYVGADDGCAYALDADTGQTVWKYRPSADKRLIPSNGKLIALQPCRTGVLVENGIAYFGMALLPWEESYFCAVDAATGSVEGPRHFRAVRKGLTMEGALLASPNKLYVPQGRTVPMVFDRQTGKRLGAIKGAGGVFAVLTPDMKLVHGPDNQKEDWIAVSDTDSGDRLASFERGNFMIVVEDRAYVLKDSEVLAVDRATGEAVWSVPCDCPYTLILAGDTLLAGGNHKVTAFAAADGRVSGTIPVSGRAYGITVANRRVFVSTDTGAIHALD